MASTTFDAIRDRIITVVSGLTPTYLAGDKFRPFTNKHSANFTHQCEQVPESSFRVFQVRDLGSRPAPTVTNTDFAEFEATMSVIVCYPQNYRYNAAPQGKQALDRDRVMSTDEHTIQYNVGYRGGRSNYNSSVSASYPDATPLGDEVTSRLVGQACDFLVLRVRFKFTRTEP